MTIQRARFLPKLFTLQAFPYHLGHRARSSRTPGVHAPAKHRMLLSLNNCKARSCQRVYRAKTQVRQRPDAGSAIFEMRHRGEACIVPQSRQHRKQEAGQAATWTNITCVIPGLDPGIYLWPYRDGRVKPGHDGLNGLLSFVALPEIT